MSQVISTIYRLISEGVAPDKIYFEVRDDLGPGVNRQEINATALCVAEEWAESEGKPLLEWRYRLHRDRWTLLGDIQAKAVEKVGELDMLKPRDMAHGHELLCKFAMIQAGIQRLDVGNKTAVDGLIELVGSPPSLVVRAGELYE